MTKLLYDILIFSRYRADIGVLAGYEVLTVTAGKRHRFRFINNGVLNCPMQISIDQHSFTAIASDGRPFQPIDVESFNIFAGERYDVIVTADQPVGNYWIRARGMGDCVAKNTSQQAVLRYQGAPNMYPTGPSGFQYGDRKGKHLNPFNHQATDLLIPVAELQATEPVDISLSQTPDKKFYVAMDFHIIDNYHFNDPFLYPFSLVAEDYQKPLPQFNNISLRMPPAPPLTQYNDIPKDYICEYGNEPKNCDTDFCECTYVLKVAVNDLVEIVLIDEGKTSDIDNHPIHLHGYSYSVVGMEKLSTSTSLAEVKKLDNEGRLKRNMTAPIYKDTVTVPDGGYTVLRFKADNPGFWFMHCHLEIHVGVGMGLFLQVGEPGQMTKIPKNFPRCGDWKFEGYEDQQGYILTL